MVAAKRNRHASSGIAENDGTNLGSHPCCIEQKAEHNPKVSHVPGGLAYAKEPDDKEGD